VARVMRGSHDSGHSANMPGRAIGGIERPAVRATAGDAVPGSISRWGLAIDDGKDCIEHCW
jgi:hypothetical protein